MLDGDHICRFGSHHHVNGFFTRIAFFYILLRESFPSHYSSYEPEWFSVGNLIKAANLSSINTRGNDGN